MAHILGISVRCDSVTEYDTYFSVKFSGNGGEGPWLVSLEYQVDKRDVGVSAYLPKPGENYTLTLGQ